MEKGQLKTNWQSFSLDATTFNHNGTRYLVWPQRDANIHGNSNLYIAILSNPWTISGKQVMISKPDVPVFETSEENGQFGPGHSSFTVSEDGTSDILIYHARNYKNIEGDPLYDPNRHTRAQKLNWNSDGTPNFGVPIPDSNI